VNYGLLSLEIGAVAIWSALTALAAPEAPLLAGAVLVIGLALAALDQFGPTGFG